MKKRSKIKRNLKLFLVTIFITLIGVNSVCATSAPKTLSIKSRNLNNPPLKFPQTFHIKETTDGKYVYCMTYAKSVPTTKIKYTTKSVYTAAGTNYILEQGYKAKNDKEYFIAQTALWIYLMDKGTMDKSSSINTFKSTVNNSSSSTAKKIKEMVKKAKSMTSYDNNDPTISLQGNVNFTLSEDGTKYVSDSVTINSSEKIYAVTFDGAPAGASHRIENGKLIIEIPVSSITSETQSFKITASNSKKVYSAYKYSPSNSGYQVMASVYEDEKTASNTIEARIALNKVVISKQDVTTKEELPGASLEVKDSNGNIIDSWTSGSTPHELELKPGTYKLKETIAPNGYELSTEEITFEVTDNGITTNVVMYNTKKAEPAPEPTPEPTPEEVPVPSTGSFKTIASSMIGALIIIIGSVLITKNLKKKNEQQ